MWLIMACAFPASWSATANVNSASDDLKGALKARYDALKAAMAAHDGSAVNAILAPDFKSVDVGGKQIDGAQMIQEVNGLTPDPNKVSSTELMSVVPKSGYVIVEQRYDMKTVKSDAEGNTHNVEFTTISTDKWVRSKTDWLLEQTVTDEVSYFQDGKQTAHKVNSSTLHP